MQQEKGQVIIILLVVVIIGIVFFINFSKSNPGILPSAAPASQEKTNISPGPKPSPVTPPSYSSDPTPDTAPPLRLNPQPSGGLLASTREIFLVLNTDENSTCRYATVPGVFYEYMQYTFSGAGSTFHRTVITALSEGVAYNYYVRCVDEWGNKNNDDFIISFWVNYPADLTPPVLSNAYPAGDVLSADAFQTMIGVSTNEPASCRYSWGQGTAYDSMSGSLSPDGTKKYHTATVTGLVAGNSYSYFVRCKDLNGNANTGDVKIHFKVGY